MKVVANFNKLPFLSKYRQHDTQLKLLIVGTAYAEKHSIFARMKSKIRELFFINSNNFLIHKSKFENWLDERNKFSSRNGSYH